MWVFSQGDFSGPRLFKNLALKILSWPRAVFIEDIHVTSHAGQRIVCVAKAGRAGGRQCLADEFGGLRGPFLGLRGPP